MTRVLMIVGFVLAATGCQSQCSRESGDEQERISLLLNWTYYGEHAPFFVAQKQNFFAEENLSVEIVPGTGSGSTVKIIGSGAHDFGYAGAGTMLKAASLGVPVLAVSVLQQVNPMAVIFRASADIVTVKDLVGKRIGVTVGDATSQLLPALLGANNLTMDDFDIVKLPTPKDKETFLLADKIDAFVGFYHDQPPRLTFKTGEKLKWIPYFSSGVNTLSSAIIVHRQKLAARPELARRFLRAVRRGVQFTRDKPQAAAEIFSAAVDDMPLPLSEEMITLGIDLHFTERSAGHPIGWSDHRDWQDTIHYLSKYSGLKSSGRPSEFYTNEFITEGNSAAD